MPLGLGSKPIACWGFAGSVTIIVGVVSQNDRAVKRLRMSLIRAGKPGNI